MITKGKIVDLREDGTATIVAPVPVGMVIHRQVKEVNVELIDSRPLSERQRRFVYSLINAIAEWSGNEPEDIKEWAKMEFWADKIDTLADKIFSLSNAPMSLIADFQKFLIKFVIENDVPLKFSLLEYVERDEIDNYVYMCLINKKCVVCGRKAELHHVDTVGRGNNREQINHIGKEAISLCRNHHEEYHRIGKTEFFERYHLNKGIEIDKTIAKIYQLRSK